MENRKDKTIKPAWKVQFLKNISSKKKGETEGKEIKERK